MNRLRRLIHAIARRTPAGHPSVESLRASTRALGRDVSSMRAALADLTTQLGAIQVEMEQLAALRREELDAPVRMDALERILDTDRISIHIRQAIAGTQVVEDPVPHALTARLLPADVYGAVIEAIPSPVFFEGNGAGGRELRVPPALAPTYSIATWAFLTDIVENVLGPALVERFQAPLDRHVASLCPSFGSTTESGIVLTAGPGRIVRRRPGGDAPPSRTRPWHFLSTILYLALPGDGEDHGSRLHGRLEIPFRANSALTVLGAAGAHEYASIPQTAPPDVVRHSYEFRLGPEPETRRRLLAAMDEATRRTWEVRP